MELSYRRDRRDPKRYWICVDGEEWREVHRSVFGRRSPFPREADASFDLEKEFATAEYRCAREYVLRRLSERSYLEADLRKMLKERLLGAEVIDTVIDDMFEYGYLDDAAWAAGYVRQRLLAKDGPRKILQALRMKGVDEGLIDAAMEVDVDQESAILRLIETRYRSRDLSDYNERQKVTASLLRKGYDLQPILIGIKAAQEQRAEAESLS